MQYLLKPVSRHPWSRRLGGLAPRRRRLRRVDGRVGDGSGAVLARRADGVQQGSGSAARAGWSLDVALWGRRACAAALLPPQQPCAASQRAPLADELGPCSHRSAERPARRRVRRRASPRSRIALRRTATRQAKELGSATAAATSRESPSWHEREPRPRSRSIGISGRDGPSAAAAPS